MAWSCAKHEPHAHHQSVGYVVLRVIDYGVYRCSYCEKVEWNGFEHEGFRRDENPKFFLPIVEFEIFFWNVFIYYFIRVDGKGNKSIQNVFWIAMHSLKLSRRIHVSLSEYHITSWVHFAEFFYVIPVVIYRNHFSIF